MNRFGCFTLGIAVGLVLMQVGHWLYLRSTDYLFAAATTAMLAVVVVGYANWIGEEWE